MRCKTVYALATNIKAYLYVYMYSLVCISYDLLWRRPPHHSLPRTIEICPSRRKTELLCAFIRYVCNIQFQISRLGRHEIGRNLTGTDGNFLINKVRFSRWSEGKKMGLLTDPRAGNGKMMKFILRWEKVLCCLLYLAGVAWMMLLALPEFNDSMYNLSIRKSSRITNNLIFNFYLILFSTLLLRRLNTMYFMSMHGISM